MDIHCGNCGEPWDTYHIWHDMIWETDLPEEQIKAWEKTPLAKRLGIYREALKGAGYEFGQSVMDIRRCPCCKSKPEAKPDLEKQEKRAILVEMLGDDEDGIAAMMEDYGL